MKYSLLLFLLVAVTACQPKDQPDTRPPGQVRFAELVQTLRDSTEAVTNPALKTQLLGLAVDSVKTHLFDSLELNFDGWNVRVLEIKSLPDSPGMTEIFYGMNIDDGPMNEKSRYHSIVFREQVDKQTVQSSPRQNLKVGSIVTISGTFVARARNINMESYNGYKTSKNVLANPALRVEIREVKL